MAERSIFWTTGTSGDGAAAISEAITTEWHRSILTPRSGTINAPNTTQGILRDVLGELAVTGTTSPVSVAAGGAVVAGYYYLNDAALTVAVPTPAANTRIDRIVLRASHGTTRTVRITRIAGVEGSGGSPALVQNAGTTWDIPLAQVSITTGGVITVTDERTLAQYATNHVKRDGDVMTGNLTVERPGATSSQVVVTATDAATLTLIRSGSPADGRRWQFITSGATKLFGRVVNDTVSATANWIDVTRSGATIATVDFPTGGDTLQSGGNPVLHTGNMALRVVTAWIANLAVTTEKLANLAVTTGKLADLAVTAAKLASNAVETAKIADLNVTAAKLASNAVITAKIANDAVTGVKITANAVSLDKWTHSPLRRGGNASDWSIAGTTNYTPATMRMQFGVVEVTIADGSGNALGSVAFPSAFTNAPVVLLTPLPSVGTVLSAQLTASTAASYSFNVLRTNAVGTNTVRLHWLALGPA
jgi:hypothetical protein